MKENNRESAGGTEFFFIFGWEDQIIPRGDNKPAL